MSKKKNGKYTGNPVIKARVNSEDKQEFERVCRDKGLNPSECLRRALKQYVEINDQR